MELRCAEKDEVMVIREQYGVGDVQEIDAKDLEHVGYEAEREANAEDEAECFFDEPGQRLDGTNYDRQAYVTNSGRHNAINMEIGGNIIHSNPVLLGDFDLPSLEQLLTYLAGQRDVRSLHCKNVSVLCHINLLALQRQVQHRVEVNAVFIDVDNRVHLRTDRREFNHEPAVAAVNRVAMVPHLVRERIGAVQREEKRLLRCVVKVGRRETQEVFDPEDAQD